MRHSEPKDPEPDTDLELFRNAGSRSGSKSVFSSMRILDFHKRVCSIFFSVALHKMICSVLFNCHPPGDFRNGKSFLLNFLIRYLEAGGQKGWMEREEEFWIPCQKSQDKSFFKQAAGFLYR